MAYQSLYRRYRSGRFDELVGPAHVVTALKNAITEGRVGHAYLFSGPRGTGKTSTARILGKALNCTDLGADGEPCCACESCLSFASGTSYDLQELDAASNNGVEAIRDLISKVALGSPGRTKVYILDEVHMLTSGAENALLKTLEEPPDHVVFVLATTEPHKVVPTIRSRTQHFEFQLIPADELGAHVRWVAQDAGLAVTDEMIDYVLRVGGGSARDTLSALDQVVAAGGIPHDDDAVAAVLAGLAAHDAAPVIAATSAAIKSGRDPRVIGESLLARLRDAFLASMSAPVDHLSDTQAAAATALAAAMGPGAITRALEVIGTALVDMRQAPDPRVDLEVALLRLSRPDLDTELSAVIARLERLERGNGAAPSTPAPAASAPTAIAPGVSAPQPAPSATLQPAPAPAPTAPAAAAGGRPADLARAALARQRDTGDGPSAPLDPPASASPSVPPSAAPAGAGPASARQTLGAHRASASPGEPAAGSASPPPPAVEPAAGTASGPSLGAVEAAWPEVKDQLSGRAKSRFSGGRFLEAVAGGVVFGLPNAIHRDRCADCAAEVERALSARLGMPVSLQLVVDGEAPAPSARGGQLPASGPAPAAAGAPPPPGDDDEPVDMDELVDASPDEADGLGLLTEAFPGAELIERDATDR